jgi:nicotinamide-nucleotide amidase
MLFTKDYKLIFSLPGVPFEMKALMLDEVLPVIVKKLKLPVILHRTILTTGLSESTTADLLEEWEDSLTPEYTFAYLPSPGILRLRVSITGEKESPLNEYLNNRVNELVKILGEKHVYGFDEDTLQDIIGQQLATNHLTLSLAESCTGGYIAKLITSVPGASRYFQGSVVAYSNEIKSQSLRVNPNDIASEGAVSETVVEQMVKGAQLLFNSSFCIATSGIAGPGGGTIEKPVGTTWIAVATPEKIISQKFLFGDNRERNIVRASVTALNLLRIAIVEFNKNSQ